MAQPSILPPPDFSPLRGDGDALLPAAEWLRHDARYDGWTAGRQAAFLAHLADHGIVADAARAVGKSLAGAYALRRKARGYAFNLGWEAALLIARRIVADRLMSAAIKGEEARWVREEGVTTYTRHNPKLALTLLDRVTPIESLSEVLAVVAGFDLFLRLIDDEVSAQELWLLHFDGALPRSDIEARDRVRAGLLLSEESAGFDAEDGGWGDEIDATDTEYKSLHRPGGAIARASGGGVEYVMTDPPLTPPACGSGTALRHCDTCSPPAGGRGRGWVSQGIRTQ